MIRKRKNQSRLLLKRKSSLKFKIIEKRLSLWMVSFFVVILGVAGVRKPPRQKSFEFLPPLQRMGIYSPSTEIFSIVFKKL